MRASGRANLLSACIALLVCGEAISQARGPSVEEIKDTAPPVDNSPAARARKLAELGAWLRRLEGQFRVTGLVINHVPVCGKVSCNPSTSLRPPDLAVQGKADCKSVGAGPGVHCVFNVLWDEPPPPPKFQIVWDAWLAPGMILFGIDPDALAIRFLQVDTWSITDEGERGVLDGDEVTFKFAEFQYNRRWKNKGRVRCVGCGRTMRIIPSPDGETIEMIILQFDPDPDFDVDYNLTLKRLPQDQG